MAKPMGPIPADLAELPLRIGGRTIAQLAGAEAHTPLFVYDLAIVRRRIATFRALFDVDLHFAMKANPYPPLLAAIAPLVDGLDVASGGELATALAAGADAASISFAGPGKRAAELAAAIAAGATLNCESEGEVERALAIGRDLGRTPRLAVRVNPDFEIKGSGMRMGGGAKPFGVDAARVPALVRHLVREGADWRGFHIFAGSQALSADAIIDAQASSVALAGALAEAAGAPPPLVNLGGGFGIPYFHGEAALDVQAVAQSLRTAIDDRPAMLTDSRFAIELGRWLIGESGVYLTRILDRKESHGKTFLIVDGGMHHQLAASGNFGQLVRRNYPVAIVHAGAAGEAPPEEVSIVGCLCTPLDRLADDVMLPPAQVGDIVVVFLAGAYGLSASPQAFLSQDAAHELLVDAGD